MTYRYVRLGQRFGQLITIAHEGYGHWVCKCDCGNVITVTSSKLNGGQRACICIRGKNQGTHLEGGHKPTVEYRAWAGMIERCYNENSTAYKWYGKRGIVVCSEWRSSYPRFLADMGRKPSAKHSLDRENTNGNYEPDNCRWALPVEQSRNQRTNRLITIDGVTRCVAEWAEVSGLPPKTLYYRVSKKWPSAVLLSPLSNLKRVGPKCSKEYGGL